MATNAITGNGVPEESMLKCIVLLPERKDPVDTLFPKSFVSHTHTHRWYNADSRCCAGFDE